MDPATATVTAAGIAAFVGSVGIIATAVSAWHTVRSNRETAQDERMWAKRSAVYEELVRHAHELKDNSQYRWESAFAARVITYASHGVLAAYRVAATAALHADMTRVLHGAEVETAKARPVSGQSVANYAKDLDAREKEADAAADALVDLIRDELGSEPSQRKRWAWFRWPWSKSWVQSPRS